MTEKFSKKELKSRINSALIDLTLALRIESPSKKTLRKIKHTVNGLSEVFKDDLKKQLKRDAKKSTVKEKKSEKKKEKKAPAKPVMAL